MHITYWRDSRRGEIIKIDEDTSAGMSYLNAPENEGAIREVTRETYLRALKEHQESIGELWNAKHRIHC